MSNLRNFAAVLAFLFLSAGVCTVASAQGVTAGQTEAVGFVGGVTDGGGLALGGGMHYAFTHGGYSTVNSRILLAATTFRGSSVGLASTSRVRQCPWI